VIYDSKKDCYLPKSKIKSHRHKYKILNINKKVYCWIGSNINGEVITTDLLTLNGLFKINRLNLLSNNVSVSYSQSFVI
jgi:hypothetical protein